MNVRRISWGLLVLFVGLILLLTNLDYIQFNWFAVFSLWPVLLILLGLSFLLPEKEESKYLMILATIGVLVLFTYQGLKPPSSQPWWTFNWEWNEPREGGRVRESQNEHFSKEYDEAIQQASLNLEGGAISYTIGKSTESLFMADTESPFDFSLADKRSGDKAEIDFIMRGEGETNLKGNNQVNMRLNPIPLWDITLSLGAGAADFDLSDYKIRRLNVEGGVSSIKIKMGLPLEETEIQFESGLASFELLIPQGAACRVVTGSALSSNNFEGFTKQEDGSYISGNYQSAAEKFSVAMDSGLSSFSIKHY